MLELNDAQEGCDLYCHAHANQAAEGTHLSYEMK